MARPADTRCRAQKGSGQCKGEITYDTEADCWAVWCEEHLAEDREARANGTERVVRV